MSDSRKIGVSGILARSNRVLLVKRAPHDVSFPGMWCTPGGGLEKYETINDCLKREFREEVGLDVEVKEPVYVAERGIELLLIFKRVEIKYGEQSVPFIHLNDEHTHFAWLEEDLLEYNHKKITPLTYKALTMFYKKHDVVV